MGSQTLLSKMFRQNAKRYEILFFPSEDGDASAFKEGEAYCRVWLAEMCLAKGIDWFKRRHPVVHAAIRFNHGGREVTIPCIAGPEFFKALTTDNLDRIIQLNHPLTPLFPFNHGLVEIQAGLFSMKSDKWVTKFIDTLSRFSKMLPVPELSSVLHLASPVYSGIEDLLGIGDSLLELGWQQTFASGNGNSLKPGYFAVIRAEQKEIENLNLGIVNSRLCAGVQSKERPRPLKGFAYMLFRIQKRSGQEWEALTRIKKLVNKTVEAVNRKKIKQAKEFMTEIKIAVLTSPDLVRNDRRQMWVKIKAALKECLLESTTLSASALSLYAIMQRPLSEPDPETEQEIAAIEELAGR